MLLFLLQTSLLELYADEKIQLEIKEAVSKEEFLLIKYKLSNLSDNDVWVCAVIGEEKIDNELNTGIVKIVNKNKASLLIGVESINTEELLLDGPVGTIFTVLKSKNSQEFSIKLKYPIIDNTGWDYLSIKEEKKKNGGSFYSSDIKDLILRVGYYFENLNGSKNCCYQMTPDQEKPGIKKVSYKWARKYKEKTVETKVNLEKKK
jgi:hypothetical protein